MASDVKKTSSQTCTRDHQARERASIEKHAQKLRSPVKRISAAQKSIYTFGEVSNSFSGDKKQDNHVDGTSKSFSAELRRHHERPKLRESSSAKSTPFTEIEKQLKGLQSQKKKINQIIFKELRFAKTNWQEVKSKSDAVRAKHVLARNDDSLARELCRTLETNAQQVESLYRSFNDMEGPRGRPDGGVFARADFTHAGGDSPKAQSLHEMRDYAREAISANEATYADFISAANRASQRSDKPATLCGTDGTSRTLAVDSSMDSNCSALSRNVTNECDVQTEGESADYGDTTAKLISDLNISLGTQDSKAAYRTSRRIEEKEKLFKLLNARSDGADKQNSDVLSTADATVPTVPATFANKYPSLGKMLPEVFKSAYLRKSCSFD